MLLSDLTFRQVGVLEETHIFNPNFINTVRIGLNRNRVDNDLSASAINPAAGDLPWALFPAGGRAGERSGLTAFSGGLGGNPTYFFRWNSFQYSDDAFVTRGTHSIKFGFVAERMQMNVGTYSNPNGVFTFPDLYSFLDQLNLPNLIPLWPPPIITARFARLCSAATFRTIGACVRT